MFIIKLTVLSLFIALISYIIIERNLVKYYFDLVNNDTITMEESYNKFYLFFWKVMIFILG